MKLRKRSLLLGLAGLLLLTGCGSLPEMAPTEPTEAASKRIVCIGDSNTYGFDPYNYGARYPEDQRWTGRLAQEGREVVNLGVNGATIPWPEELEAVRQQLSAREPTDLVIVMLGTNDILCGYTVSACLDRMNGLLLAIREVLPESELLLVAPPPTPLGTEIDRTQFSAAYRDLAAGYRELAERLELHFADAADWNIELGPDELHFSAEGHRRFAEAVEELLKELGLLEDLC